MSESVQQVKKYATHWFGLAARGIYPAAMLEVFPISTNRQISDMRAAGNVLRSQEATFRSQLNLWLNADSGTPQRLPVLGTSVLQRAPKRRLEANYIRFPSHHALAPLSTPIDRRTIESRLSQLCRHPMFPTVQFQRNGSLEEILRAVDALYVVTALQVQNSLSHCVSCRCSLTRLVQSRQRFWLWFSGRKCNHLSMLFLAWRLNCCVIGVKSCRQSRFQSEHEHFSRWILSLPVLSFSCNINEAALSSSLTVCKHVLPHVYHEFILSEFFHVGLTLLFHAALEQATSHGHQHARTVRVDGDNHFRSKPSTKVGAPNSCATRTQRLPLRVPVEAEFEVEHGPHSVCLTCSHGGTSTFEPPIVSLPRVEKRWLVLETSCGSRLERRQWFWES